MRSRAAPVRAEIRTTRPPLVSSPALQRLLPSLPQLSPLLQLQLFSSPPPWMPHPRGSCQLSPLRRDGSCDSTRWILKVALCAKVNDRIARADLARIPCPS